MGFATQLRTLSWKNFVLHRRQKLRLVVEILVPLCSFLFLLILRNKYDGDLRKSKGECHYAPRAMPSAGTIPFIQSYMCEMKNPCNKRVVNPDPRTANAYNSSLIDITFKFMEKVLASESDTNTVLKYLKDIGFVDQETINMAKKRKKLKDSFSRFDSLMDFNDTEVDIGNDTLSIAFPDKAFDRLMDAAYEDETYDLIYDLYYEFEYKIWDTVYDLYDTNVDKDWIGFFGRLFCGRSFDAEYAATFMVDKKWEDRNPRFDPTIIFDGMADYKDNNIAYRCRSLFAAMDLQPATKLLWNIIKPFALGVVPFTPDTPATRKIIKEASKTFDSFSSLLNLLQHLEPSIPDIQQTVENYTDWLDCLNLNKFVPYSDLDSLTEASLKHMENNTFWAAIVFDNIDSDTVELPTVVKYSIRMHPDRVDNTKDIKDKYWRPGGRDRPWPDLKYFMHGFIYIQDIIDHAIIRLQTNQTQKVGVYTQQFPYPCWTYDRFMFVISRLLPLFMMISWIYSVAMIIKGIVYEKERRLKEVMKMMGLGNGVHWLAWFISTFIVMLITILFFLIILKKGNILANADCSIVFVFMLAFATSTISQCFLISVFFNKANLAAVCGGMIFFVLFLPYTLLVQWETEITATQKTLVSLLSNVAMGYGCHYFALYEEQAIGLNWNNVGKSPMVDDDFSMQMCITMMFIDTFIYLILTWYIENVFPGQYGMPRKWYFPIQKSYWLGKSTESIEHPEITHADNTSENPNIEKESQNLNAGVKVCNLRKVYKGGKVAVDGLTVNFYEDQITSFLGHNGAGKTTTMSILTGLFPPTSGTAYIYGKNILTSIDDIRCDLGMCPQHNVLFDLLTVEEHIWFYARLKGCSEKEVQAELDQMVQDVGLPHKRKERSNNLSGGMKRKLSVAIAFVGGSKTVILDEPTAGVDPYARRTIWELLLKLKKGRTIILSTHHMDEADVLGDRIAIISQGKLCTIGSSMFLKNRFGTGYYLTLVRQDEESEMRNNQEDDGSSFFSSRSASLSSQSSNASSSRTSDMKFASETEDEGYFDKRSGSSPMSLQKIFKSRQQKRFSLRKLKAFIKKFVPNAELVEDNSMEVSFRLPEGNDHAARFEQLFEALESSHLDMGISSYGISDTSLEEVFLKATDDNWKGIDEDKHENGSCPEQSVSVDEQEPSECENLDFTGAGNVDVKGNFLMAKQLSALLIKRFHHVRRCRKGFFCEIILPAVLVCLAMIIYRIWPPYTPMPPLELQPWMYEPTTGTDSSLNVFYSNENPWNKRAHALEAEFLQSTSYGTRCMKESLHSIAGKPCFHDSRTNSAWSRVKRKISKKSPSCSCDSGFQHCPAGAGGPKPSQRKLPTNDNVLNMTGRSVSDWLVKTKDHYLKRRYGGFTFGAQRAMRHLKDSQITNGVKRLIKRAKKNQPNFSRSEMLLKSLEDVMKTGFVQDNAKVWFNNKGWTSSVSYMNGLNNLILRSLLPPEKDPKDYGIVTINHPMNLNRDQFEENNMNWVDFIVAICVIFAMSFVPASFVLFLIEERVSNSKHLQFVSGINPTIYWISNSLWDYVNYIIPALICIFIFLAFGHDAYTSCKHFPCLLALLVLYGWAINPMMYPFSRMFKVASSAFVALASFNMFIGFFTTVVTFVLDFLEQEHEDLAELNNVLKQVFLVFPHYCLGRGLLDLAFYKIQSEFYSRIDQDFEYDLFEWNVIGRNLFAMALVGFIFSILNLLIEYKFFLSQFCITRPHIPKTQDEDIDVAREKKRVLSGEAANDLLRIEGLTKVFLTPNGKSRLRAVDRLYLGVPKGQCFGLLGVNGAGKTTTFKMLTGGVDISNGDAYIDQKSVCREMVQACQHMGYCPQFDALDPLLTGREHLEFYARVRGIPRHRIKDVTDWVIQKMDLQQYEDKMSNSYSGGNKRKLSTAIALIGNPPLIFLDEPTTGMDPKAKRYLWNRINNIVKAGHSVILTSHSMEECEALCSRLAIMVNGSFQCIGSIQHLKNRFGNGYTIVLRVNGQTSDLSPVVNFITSRLPSAKLIEEHHNMLQYQLGAEGLSLSQLFHTMEETKQKHGVESFSVSQTTLDQVFINFAKKQTDMLDDELYDYDDYSENDDDEDEEMSFKGDVESMKKVKLPEVLSASEPSDMDYTSWDGHVKELVKPSNGQTHCNETTQLDLSALENNKL